MLLSSCFRFMLVVTLVCSFFLDEYTKDFKRWNFRAQEAQQLKVI